METNLWSLNEYSFITDVNQCQGGRRVSAAGGRLWEVRSWLSMVADVPNPDQVMSLKNNDDFLMHGVVLQIRVFRFELLRCFT